MSEANPINAARWRIRRLMFVLTAGFFLGWAFLLAQRTPHGFFWGTWHRSAELVFSHDAIYFGTQPRPRSTGGIGYDLLYGFTDWSYFARSTEIIQLPGFCVARNALRMLIIRLSWWLLAATLLVLILIVVRPLIQQSDDPRIYCECGYDLRATPERCPECGRIRTRHSARPGGLDGRIGFWCAAVAAIVTLADFMINARDSLPRWATLVQLAAAFVCLPLLATDVWLRRRVNWPVRGAIILLVAASLRVFIVKLNA